MNCAELERELQAAVESRCSVPHGHVAEHVAACPRCRELWGDDRLLSRVIPDWKEQTPEVNLVDVVLAKLPAWSGRLHDRPDHRRRTRSWVLLAVVAGVMMLAGRLLLIDADRSPTRAVSPGQPIASSNPAPAPSDVQPSASQQPQLNLLIQDATSAYLELAHEAAAAVRDAVVFVPDQVKVPGVRSQFPAAPTLDPSWKMNIEPIGQDLQKALDFLMQSVPTGQG